MTLPVVHQGSCPEIEGCPEVLEAVSLLIVFDDPLHTARFSRQCFVDQAHYLYQSSWLSHLAVDLPTGGTTRTLPQQIGNLLGANWALSLDS